MGERLCTIHNFSQANSEKVQALMWSPVECSYIIHNGPKCFSGVGFGYCPRV
jgi:hypothetical protein